jgi:hypothetical protein
VRCVPLAAVAALAAASCPAVTFAPSPAEIAAAAAAGEVLAAAGEGYPLAEYLVYQVPDARQLRREDGCVDAVATATPLERTRHAAYLAALESRRIGAAAARLEARLPDQSIEVVVFAHGRERGDATFTERFRAVRLLVGGGEVKPVSTEASEPVEATYPLAIGDAHRAVATVTWRFELAAYADDATPLAWLRFTDPCGEDFRVALPLAALR